MGVIVVPLTGLTLDSIDKQHVGVASGLNSSVSHLGGLLATALLGSTLGRSGDALIDTARLAMLVGAFLCVVAAFVAMLTLPRTRRQA